MTYVDSEGQKHEVQGEEGQDLMRLAHENDIDLEGACEGSLACSTCHVIVEPEYYKKLPEPSDEENDMLDLAFGLTETYTLGAPLTRAHLLMMRGGCNVVDRDWDARSS